jgi:transposase
MLFAGVDLHKKTITVVVVDASRNPVRRQRFSNHQTANMADFFRQLGPFELTVEATASYEWFVELVEPLASRVLLAHPGKLRIIAESTRKTDNLDAKVLAEMLALGQIPVSYRPTPRQREHRLYVRHRVFLQRKITGVRNKIRRLLSNHNLDRPDLFTGEGMGFLAELNLGAADRFCVNQLVAQWEFFRTQLRQVDRQLLRFAAEGPLQEYADRQRLRTVPGVGIVTSDVILAELADWRRVPSIKDVVSYAGLVPGQRESAGKRKSLHIEKTGSRLLRWVLVQSAWQLVRRSPHWHTVYGKLRARMGAKKAIVAIARRLLGLCYSLLKNQADYREYCLTTRTAAATTTRVPTTPVSIPAQETR